MTVSADFGYWTGSLSYQPSWSSSGFTIPFGSLDANNVAWVLQGVTGWDSPPVAVGAVIQRSADHGGWPTAQFYGPRIITLTVWASAPSQALRDQARLSLQQAVPFSDLATFTYDEPVPKLAYVRRNAASTIGETYPTTCDVIFSIPLVAPDPRKYAVNPVTTTSLTVVNTSPLALPFTLPVTFPPVVPLGSAGVLAVNSGNFETRPVITVTGPITNPAVTNGSTGQVVSFTGLTLTASEQLVLYTDLRQAYIGGQFYPADSSSAWFVLEPGSTLVSLSGTAANGSVMSLTYSSAYI
jgi:Phage tail protein